MTTIAEAAARWRTAQQDFEQMAAEAMEQNNEALAQVIVEQQSIEHIDSTGVPLRQYTAAYKRRKIKLGLSGDPDLELTGDMHSKVKITVVGNTYKVESDSTTKNGLLKVPLLQKWNGKEMMLPDAENKGKFWRIIRPSVVDKLAEVTGCGTS